MFMLMLFILLAEQERMTNDNKQHNLPWAPDPAMLGVFILEALQI